MQELQGIVAITDRGWLDFLRGVPDLEEANFWKPSSRRAVRRTSSWRRVEVEVCGLPTRRSEREN